MLVGSIPSLDTCLQYNVRLWPCVVCADAGAHAFVLPMIVGSISQLSGVEASAHGKSVR
jgi:hypothetical protein